MSVPHSPSSEHTPPSEYPYPASWHVCSFSNTATVQVDCGPNLSLSLSLSLSLDSYLPSPKPVAQSPEPKAQRSPTNSEERRVFDAARTSQQARVVQKYTRMRIKYPKRPRYAIMRNAEKRDSAAPRADRALLPFLCQLQREFAG